MRKTPFTLALLLLLAFSGNSGCNHTRKETKGNTRLEESKVITETPHSSQTTYTPDDREALQILIREMLKWANSRSFSRPFLHPLLTDSNHTVTGIDWQEGQTSMDKLRATGFFAEEFIENYHQILSTLDARIKNNEFGEFSDEDQPPFAFATDADPWCNCQDVPFDDHPFDYVEVEVTERNGKRAKLIWKWGNLNPNTDTGWREFSYRAEALKENGHWKIAYLDGFDLSLAKM